MAEPSAKDVTLPTPRRFVSLDVETTQLDPATSEIIDIGLVAFHRGGILERFSSLVRPEGEVPLTVQNLTGITPQELEDAPSFSTLREDVRAFIGDSPVVGQSIDFDLAHLRMVEIFPSGGALDTFHLASIFLPGLGSYRLEVIAEALGVDLADAHRALPDAEATAEVFLKLLLLIEERVSPELGADLFSILERSPYGLRELWGELVLRGDVPYEPQSATTDFDLGTADAGATRFVRGILDRPESRIAALVRPRTRLSAAWREALQSKTFTLAVPSFRQAAALSEATGVPLRLSGEHYLSKRLAEAYLGSAGFSEREAVFALKLRYFLSWTKTGRRDELSLYDTEYQLWRLLSCRRTGGEAFMPERGAAGAVTNHLSLPALAVPGTLVVSDFQLLDEVLSASEGVRVDQRDGELFQGELRSAFDLLLGLAGIVLENFSEPSAYGRQLRVRQAVLRSKQWLQFRDAALHFNQLSGGGGVIEQELLLQTQDALRLITERAETDVVWLAERYGGLSLRLVPSSVTPLLGELFQSPERVIVMTKSLEGLPGEFTVVEEEGRQDLEVLVVRSGGRSERELIQEVLIALGDEPRIGLFCPSASMVREVFEPLSRALDREVVATGFSGSEARLVELARREEAPVTIAGPRLWTDDRLDEVFDVVVAPRLSFDPPSEPIHQARSEVGGGFMGYSLPRSAAKLRCLAAKLRPGGRLILLDQRLITQRYGAELIRSLDLPTREVDADEV